MTNFQRVGSISNAHVGHDFEVTAQRVLLAKGLAVGLCHTVLLGVANQKKLHDFDLGSEKPKVLVECKSHTWTAGDKVPSAKMINWSEAMYYFSIAPNEYRKVFFVQRSIRRSTGETLASYYRRTKFHLVPPEVEFWEYDLDSEELFVFPAIELKGK